MTQDNLPQSVSQEAQFGDVEQAESQPGNVHCAACQQPITDAYFTANEAIVCSGCRETLLSQLTGGSRIRRLLGALGLGLLMGIGGSILWFAVRTFTGYELGLVAIVVGLMVGWGVRRGSGSRGGWAYQTLAVILTYSAIVAQYIPDVFQALIAGYRDQQQVSAVQPETKGQPVTERSASGNAAAAGEVASGPASVVEEEQISAGAAIGAIFLLAVFLFAIAAAAPILAGFENLIGLLIIGFALYEAWKLNKRPQVSIQGPFGVETPAGFESTPG